MTNNITATSGSRSVSWTSNPQPRPNAGTGVQWGANFQLGGNSLQSLLALLQKLLAQLMGGSSTKPNPPISPNPNVKPTPNNNPVAVNDSSTTPYGQAVTLNVLSNDSDKDGDPLSVKSFTQPSNGTVSQGADGKLVYTPKEGFTGTDSFQYTVSDGKGGTATATATVTVGAKPNKAPVAVNDATVGEYNKPVSLNVLGNDSDPDGDSISIKSFDTTSANGGTVAKDASGNLVYTPKDGFTGTDTFKYTIDDGKGGTATATASVTVKPQPNKAPVAVNDATVGEYNKPVSLNVLGNDSDPDGDSISIKSFDTTSANGGTVAKDASGNLVYTPKDGFTGTDTFKYTIDDGKGGTATATASVTIKAKPNTAPVANADSATTPYGQAVTLNNLSNDTDADGDALSITNFTQPSHGKVTQGTDGKLVYTPDANFSGTDTFNYTVSDGKGGTATATATVTVGAKPNSAPVANKDTANTAHGAAVTINALKNDTDADGDTLTISAFDATTSKGGTITKDSSGNLVYTPAAGFAGKDTFNYTVSDGKGGTSTTTVDVVVAGPVKPNDGPWYPNGWIK